ncbi:MULTISPECIES: hypothetical protein [Lactobacillus]|uniref:hypothetical protein n=1 Tax=Lactobacillus TaxID=1578 RepID=UPI00129ED9B9|nr:MULTISPECIES: hypothetical protein [Lactobacillus]MRM99236.1 hypothetical protein [Lactobacillus taiwanensis]
MYLVREEPVQEKLDALKARDSHAISKEMDWTSVGVYKVMKDTGTQKLDDNNQPLILIADTELLELELANGTYKFVLNRKGQRLFIKDFEKGETHE